MLTKKQRDLLVFINERLSGGDIAPSFDEMKLALGLKSKSGIHRLINGLVERGYLARLPNRARALEVVRMPETLGTKINETVRTIANNVTDAFRYIPLVGKIAAGTAIEAIEHNGPTIPVPADMLRGAAEYYALKVEGDSMIEAGIHNNDTVIIRRTQNADQGKIIVALIDEHEVTLKRLRRKDGKVILQAENPAYEDRALDPARVKIQGELASLIRQYD